MKNYISIILTAAMTLTLAACTLSLIHISEPTRP